MSTPPTDQDDRSIGELLGAVGQDLTTLLRQEVELAKAEVKQSATRAGAGAGMLGGAGVAAHFVLLFVSLSAWWGISQWTGQAWGALIIAVVWAVVAGVLAALGRTRLAQVQGLPRTTETAKHVPDALKGKEETR
ncbi:putative superfamily III holin-X [Terracoccus luteus]|uniref:Putative superfamily III holin-X n=1 Tax=Terracoccus luteus TaxID=53356 RepID=A0A495XWJ6_9MICO|nr:phage holin family protein [Terracoccus luteus]RKT76843.1 putative superfamily III holin-X [Terracoccus luteus]